MAFQNPVTPTGAAIVGLITSDQLANQIVAGKTGAQFGALFGVVGTPGISLNTAAAQTGTLNIVLPAAGDVAYNVTMTGASTIVLPAGNAGQYQRAFVQVGQDATAGRVLTLPTSGVNWIGGVPTPNTITGKADKFIFTWFGTAQLDAEYQLVTLAAPVEAITVTTPAAQTANTAFTLAGTYANAVPTSLDYSLDGGTTWVAATAPTVASGAYSFSLTVTAANAAQTVKVRDHNNTTAVGTSGAFAVAAAGGAAGNAAFYAVTIGNQSAGGQSVTQTSVSGIVAGGASGVTFQPGQLKVVETTTGNPKSGTAYFALSSSSTVVPIAAAAGGDFAVHGADYTTLANAAGTTNEFVVGVSAGMNVFPNGHAAGTTRTLYLWIVQDIDRTKGGVLSNAGGPIPITATY